MAGLTVCRTISAIFTRLIACGYVALAVFAALEARKLLNAEYTLEGSTVFIPLVLCVPNSIEVDGTVVSTDTADGVSTCRELDYLINACASSLLFSALAVLIFLVIDCLARSGRGNMHTAAGTGLFLIFILVQAGICTGALVEQAKFWSEYFEEVYTNIEGSGIEKVETYANQFILQLAAISAFASGFLIVLDATIQLCCAPNEQAVQEKERQAAVAEMKAQSEQFEANNGDTSASEPDTPVSASIPAQTGFGNSPSWTSGI